VSDAASQLLEQTLAARLGRAHCVLTGRAASAVHIALCALELRPGKVVVPAITCPSPATVPLYSGHQPLFCDVSLRDFNMCPQSLRRVLSDHADVAAIIPVHLYGQAAPMREILEIAAERGIPVIEDAAQALGARYQGRMLGSLGDVSVVSFGHTKTLDVGWGGAVLTDDDGIAARLRAESSLLPARPPHIDRLFEEWRKVYYSLIPLAEMNPALHALFLPLPEIFRDMYLFKLEQEQVPGILAALDHLPDLVAARRAHARAYRAALQHPALHHPELDESDAPWRYSFLVGNGLQKHVTRALRAAGIDVSNWYPSLHRWYAGGRSQDPSLFEKALRLEREVVNLWVTPNLPAGRIDETCAIIQRVLSDNL
jgi:dTDP-4-amino-4,6-dideoxygalactose transaminase